MAQDSQPKLPSGEFLFGVIERYWFQKKGLFAALLLVSAPLWAMLAYLKVSAWIFLLFTLAAAIAVLIAWSLSRALPKTKSNKVGFLVSISCDDEEEARRIRQDFILTLRRLIGRGKAGSTFQFIEVPPHYSERVFDHDDAQALRVATRAHFVLWGRVRLRQFNDADHHFIELDGIVAHKPIPDQVSQQLAQEFSELLPRKVLIAKENDLLAFEFTSEWAEIVAKYVIAIAAAVSGDVTYAEQLYGEVAARIGAGKQQFPIFAKLQERLPLRLLEITDARARQAYEQWAASHESTHIRRLGDVLTTARDYQKSLNLITLQAVFAFLDKRDSVRSLDFLKQIPEPAREGIWHLNVAFLYAYQGNLKKAARHYQAAVAFPLDPDLLSKIEDFLCYVADQDIEKYQLFYCLGYFNWKFKGDHAQAIKDFGVFLAAGDPKEFQREKELAKVWIDELSRKLSASFAS